ncbi:MAG TPA: hypothetical protein VK348_08690, partial [Planctomycetota bacterium]|nr:hypothetical protein [Planctomycetota bacterium]
MNRTAGIALATVLAAVAAGQDPRLSALAGRDEAAAERALRQLLPLLASEPLQLPVVAVLARHGLATDRLAQGADLADAAAAALCLPFVAEAELAARLGNQGLAGRRRADALFALQDRGRLGDELLVQALADDDELLVRAAQAVFRHERAELPAGLLARLRRDRAATAAALAALAAAPRPSAQSFAAACAADAKLPARERLRALAAVGQPLDRAAAEFVLQSVAAGTDDGVRLALALVPPAVADQLVGRAQALLADGVEPAALAPLLERLTPLGELQLLGAAAALPEQPRDNLYRHLAAVDRPQFWQRVRAATDGEIPLEGHWLRYCGKLLDRPARVQRVLAVLRDEQAAQPLRERAFQALVTAHVYDPSLLAFAAAAADDAPFRQLLADAKDLPEPVFLQALQRPGAVALQAVTALERRALPPPLERELLALAQQLDEGDGPNGFALAAQACRTLAAQGSEAALQAVWALVRPRVRLAIEVLSSFTARAGPWIHPLLLAELARGARAEDGEERQQLLDAVRLELV